MPTSRFITVPLQEVGDPPSAAAQQAQRCAYSSAPKVTALMMRACAKYELRLAPRWHSTRIGTDAGCCPSPVRCEKTSAAKLGTTSLKILGVCVDVGARTAIVVGAARAGVVVGAARAIAVVETSPAGCSVVGGP
jgi:hypothetical protein